MPETERDKGPDSRVHAQASPYHTPWTRRELAGLALWRLAWPLLASWTPKFLNPWRLLVLRGFGAKLEGVPFVHPRARVAVPWQLTMRHRACLGEGAHAYSLGAIEIGEGATVAQECYLCAGTHDFADPNLPLVTKSIRIGAHAFVGARVLVLPGVSIGEGAVIGAASVVTKDFPARMMGAGNPCRVLRPRPVRS